MHIHNHTHTHSHTHVGPTSCSPNLINTRLLWIFEKDYYIQNLDKNGFLNYNINDVEK